MEEVARLSGYDKIPTTHPVSQVVAKSRKKRLHVRDAVRQALSGWGFSEIITYSFIGNDACDKFLLPDDDRRRRMVPILNPLTEDQDVMRTSLLPVLLDTMARNELPDEVEMVSGLWTGLRHERSWHANPTAVDFYDIKGSVESLCAALNVKKIGFQRPRKGEYPYLKPGHMAQVYAEGAPIGVVGEIAKKVLEGFGLKQPAFCFDLDFDRLVDLVVEEKRAKPISRFPATARDVALIVSETVEAQNVLDFIQSREEALLEDVEIFDVYKGAPIAKGKKSMALKFTYRSFERNLTDSEVNDIHEKIIRKALNEFKAQLPVK
jgi:phenylalanyl-tRNA synthetase beta chain